MAMQRSPQIGDRITAIHLRDTDLCRKLHQKEVHGYVKDLGRYVFYVIDGETTVTIHIHGGWQVTIHPEISKEE
jgi:hypothetical protein